MRAFAELVGLQDRVELAEVAAVEADDGAGPEDRLVLVEFADVGVGHRKRPEKARQALDVAALLQGLADGSHLGHGEVERRQRKHGVGKDGRRCHGNGHADAGRRRCLRVGARAGPGAETERHVGRQLGLVDHHALCTTLPGTRHGRTERTDTATIGMGLGLRGNDAANA